MSVETALTQTFQHRLCVSYFCFRYVAQEARQTFVLFLVFAMQPLTAIGYPLESSAPIKLNERTAIIRARSKRTQITKIGDGMLQFEGCIAVRVSIHCMIPRF